METQIRCGLLQKLSNEHGKNIGVVSVNSVLYFFCLLDFGESLKHTVLEIGPL